MGYFKLYFLTACLLFLVGNIFAQTTVSGTVYDSTRTIPVKNVLVKSKTGAHAITDSLGQYTIVVKKNDSIAFVYHNKSTPQFAISEVENLSAFDIALRVRVLGKFKTLKEITVTSRSYKEDSVDNREDYEQIFNYQKPHLQTSMSEYSGNAGLDLDELINMFRVKHNRDMRFMQQRLIEDEQDSYVNYRFNKGLIKRITTIDSSDIDTFIKQYRPGFIFTRTASTTDFYQYILDASYKFKADKLQCDSLKISVQ